MATPVMATISNNVMRTKKVLITAYIIDIISNFLRKVIDTSIVDALPVSPVVAIQITDQYIVMVDGDGVTPIIIWGTSIASNYTDIAWEIIKFMGGEVQIK